MRKKRTVQEINGGPMADIAFLLLIFFLVATTINVDSGLPRRLPPMPEGEVEPDQINRRNIMTVLVNKNDDLLVQGERILINDLKEKAKEFILNEADKLDLPEKEEQEFPYIGVFRVPQGVISLQNDRGTSYGAYIAVQNELTAAYEEIRDDLAMRAFGMRMRNLDEERADVIRSIYPMAISEAEPRHVE